MHVNLSASNIFGERPAPRFESKPYDLKDTLNRIFLVIVVAMAIVSIVLIGIFASGAFMPATTQKAIGGMVGGALGLVGNLTILALYLIKNRHLLSCPKAYSITATEQGKGPSALFNPLVGVQDIHTRLLSEYLPLRELGAMASTCKYNSEQVPLALLARAQFYGYSGQDQTEAKKYLQGLYEEIRFLAANDIFNNKLDPEAILFSLREFDKKKVWELVKKIGNNNCLWLMQYLLKLASSGVISGDKVSVAADDAVVLGFYRNGRLDGTTLAAFDVFLRIATRESIGSLLFNGVISLEKTKKVLDAGVDVKNGKAVIDGHIVTPLWFLINTQTRDVCREVAPFLLERGAIVDLPKKNKLPQRVVTPLGLAASRGLDDLVDLLIAKNATIDSVDLLGKTPLCCALIDAENQTPIAVKEKIARTLIDNGADVRVATNDGNTPLHYAAKAGASKEFIAYMVEKGASLQQRNARNHRALDLAISSRKEETIRALIQLEQQ